MNMLRILHVYQSRSFSGAEAYALDVATHQAKDHDVTFLAAAGSPLETRARSNLAKVETVCGRLDLTSFDVVVLHSTQELKRKWLRLAWAKTRARMKRCRVPKVVLYTHIWISHSKRDPLHAVPYSVLDQVWCSSEQSRNELVRYLPVRADAIQVIRYGRDVASFMKRLLSKTEAREKLHIPHGVTVVGTLARVDKGKGSRELFEAVTSLMPTRPDLHLLMIGPPTDGDPKAAELDEELHVEIGKMAPNLRNRIHKIGRLDGGAQYLAAFDLFVLATYKENFALTLLEALCAKLPCLATDTGGSPDVVLADTGTAPAHATGWLFKPASTDSLRSTLVTALNQKEKWHDFGQHGHKLVTDNFDFNHVMKVADQKIRDLINA